VGLRDLTRELDRLMTQGRPERIRELVEVGALAPDDAAELEALPLASCGSTLTTSEDLLELGVRLKQPAVQTVDAGGRHSRSSPAGWATTTCRRSPDKLPLTTGITCLAGG